MSDPKDGASPPPTSLDEKRKERDDALEKQGEGTLEFLKEAAKYQEQLRTKREADRKKKNDELIRDVKRGPKK